MTTAYEEKIVAYYEHCDMDYRLVWHLDTHLCMHYGYWDETTKRLRDALLRMNEKLAELAQLTEKDFVLDAGCGVGGASIFLAKNFNCRVKGITLSAKQVAEAKQNALHNEVSKRVDFATANYCSTGFADGSFDVVWAIESVCYAKQKADFIKEAYRLLKPGGRLVVADFFRKEMAENSEDRKLMKRWTDSWAIDDYEIADKFEMKMKDAGFANVKRMDVTQNIYPSIRRLYFYYYPGVVCDAVLRFFGLRKKIQRENMRSTLYQHETYQRGLWSYNFFYGEKE